MSVPDLETVPFRILKREDEYEIRQVESYYVAETTMPGRTGFDFSGSSQSFNVLASYLFGKSADGNKWKMSFVMPSKYGPDLPQAKDPSVTIKEVPSKIVAVAAFPGLVTDDDISQRESRLRKALQKDTQYRVKEDSVVEIAQYNPPFTLPFARRNEVALEVEGVDSAS
uniref:Heme-binding-like protein n=1 Tax=Aegilops tauschii TaxID=37682 RepID=R7W005_AEGTA